MGLVDKLKSAVFEDGPSVRVSTPRAVLPITQTVPTQQPMTASAGMSSGDVSHYQRLRDNTDFDQTEVGAALKRFSAPLDGVITDDKQKFQAVLALARTQDSTGSIATKILTTFDSLLASLTRMQADFKTATDAYQHDEIEARQEKLKTLNDGLAQMQQEISSASRELVNAQTKLRTTSLEFDTACQRRTAELKEQKAHFASLMKG
jgi:hypothetical protein